MEIKELEDMLAKLRIINQEMYDKSAPTGKDLWVLIELSRAESCLITAIRWLKRKDM